MKLTALPEKNGHVETPQQAAPPKVPSKIPAALQALAKPHFSTPPTAQHTPMPPPASPLGVAPLQAAPPLAPLPNQKPLFESPPAQAPGLAPLPADAPILAVLPRLNIVNELRLLGVAVMAGAGSGGWQQCRSVVDGHSIAQVHPETGFYHDPLLGLESHSFFELLMRFWAFADERAVRVYLVARANGEKMAPPNRRPLAQPEAQPQPETQAEAQPAAQQPPAIVIAPQPTQAVALPTPTIAPAAAEEPAIPDAAIPDQPATATTAATGDQDWAESVRVQSQEVRRLKQEADLAAILWQKAVDRLHAVIDGHETDQVAPVAAPAPETPAQFLTASLAKPLANVTLAEIGLSAAEVNCLQKAGVVSAESLQRHVAGGTLTSLPKVGKAKAQSMAGCLSRYLRAREQHERETGVN